MRLSLLPPANIVTASFCKIEPEFYVLLPLLRVPLIKVKAQFLLWQDSVKTILNLWFGKGLTNFVNRMFSCNQNTTQHFRDTSGTFCHCRTIAFCTTTDIKLNLRTLWVKLADDPCPMYFHFENLITLMYSQKICCSNS